MASWESYPPYPLLNAQHQFIAYQPGQGSQSSSADLDDSTNAWTDVSPSSCVSGQQQLNHPWRDTETQYDPRPFNEFHAGTFSDGTWFAREIFHPQMAYQVMPWKVQQPTSLDVAQCHPRLEPGALSSGSDSSYEDSPSPIHLPYPVDDFGGFFSISDFKNVTCGVDPCATIHDIRRTCEDDVDPMYVDLTRISSKQETHPPASSSNGLSIINSKSEERSQQSRDQLSPSCIPKGDSFYESECESEYEPTPRAKPRGISRSHAITKVTKLRSNKISKRRQSLQDDKIIKAIASGECSTKVSCNTEEAKTRFFTCPLWPYGCHADFPSKNEWKRHFNSQHLCLGFWRCDLCNDHEVNPNDFNRKDLFQQHLKRMHFAISTSPSRRNPKNTENQTSPLSGIDTTFVTSVQLEKICHRCYVEVHGPPQEMACIFCPDRFRGNDSCKAWLEHIGKHLSKHSKGGKQDMDVATIGWDKDDILKAWLLEVGVIVPDSDQEGSWRLAQTTVTSEIKARAFARKQSASAVSEDAEGDED